MTSLNTDWTDLPVCSLCGAEIDEEVIVESDDEDAVLLCEDCLDE